MLALRLTALAAGVGLTSGASGQPPAGPKPVVTFTGHAAAVTAVAFGRDGKEMYSAGPKDVRRWEAASGKEVAGFSVGPVGGGGTLALGPDGPDGPTLAVARFPSPRDEHVALLAAAGGKERLTIAPHALPGEKPPAEMLAGSRPHVGAVAFSPDGKRLVTSGGAAAVGGRHGLNGGAVRLWDAGTGKELRRFGEVKMWDKNRGDHFIPPDAKAIPGVSTSSFAGAAGFSPDGKYVVAGTDGAGGELPESGEVWVWAADDGKVVRSFKVQDKVEPGRFHSSVSAVAVSGDGKFVAAAVGSRPPRSDGWLLKEGPASEVRVWELASGKAVHTLHGHKGRVASVAFSPDGKRLASAGGDRVVRLWGTVTGKEIAAFPFDTPGIAAVAFSPDGRHLAAGGGDDKSGVVAVWACPKE